MNHIEKNLKTLEEIASNPNLRGGLWNSFSLFISISDDLLDKEALLKNALHGADETISELKSIKEKFSKTFGFNLESGNGFGDKFIKMKNNPRESHKSRKKLTNFIQSFKGHFYSTQMDWVITRSIFYYAELFDKFILQN